MARVVGIMTKQQSKVIVPQRVLEHQLKSEKLAYGLKHISYHLRIADPDRYEEMLHKLNEKVKQKNVVLE